MATNFVWRGGGWADVGLLVMITVVVVVVASATAAAACRRCFCHYCSCLCFVRLRFLSVKGCKLLDQYQSFFTGNLQYLNLYNEELTLRRVR